MVSAVFRSMYSYEKATTEMRRWKYRFEVLRVSFKVTDSIPSVTSAPSVLGHWFTVVDCILFNIRTPIYRPPLMYFQDLFAG